ncbi:MAG: peptidoglycan D,D-transpeptidase FtsI family protein [Lysobacteraceae bacterium]
MRSRNRQYNVRGRALFVGVALAFASSALVARAGYLQLVNNDFLQQQGDARFLREIPIPVSRGMITDRNGEPLAVSSPVESIWANPQALLQHAGRIPELAGALRTDEAALAERIQARADREFVYLRRHMNPDDAEAILALGIPGVHSQREFRRFYPQGEVVAHVLGFTNIDERGQEGLELAFDEWLTGREGRKRIIRDRRGRIVENVDLVRAPEPGRDLALSIDRRIQYLAWRELNAALQRHDASAGSVVVMDVRSGEILAMVNAPSYNPNARHTAQRGAMRNRAVTDVLEPGSVIKTLTVAAALETGRVTPETVVPTSPGFMTVHRHTVRDIRNFGTLSVTGLLTKSSNVASVKLAQDMPPEHLFDVLNRFGLGQPTGSGFPGEAAGVLPGVRNWGPVERATISFGYGVSTTPLQLAQAYAAIGNGGRLVTPTFVHGGQVQSRQIIDPQLARQLVDMLETVTGPEGSATRARVMGYRVAGKTGTSRKASVGGYQRRYLSLFAGLVPASDPRLAMVVVVDDPKGEGYFGGLVAAPVFAGVMDGALRLLDVPPDASEQWYAQLPPVVAPVYDDGAPAEAEVVPGAIPGSVGP